MRKSVNFENTTINQKISAQVGDLEARMAVVTSRMTDTQKNLIAGQFERERVLHGLAREVAQLEENFRAYYGDLEDMKGGLASVEGHMRGVAQTMDDYLSQVEE